MTSLPSSPAADTAEPSAPPIAAVRETTRTHHGHTVVDEYEWMRDKDDPELIAYLEAENSYSEQETAHLADLREAVYGEIKSRTQETDLSVPTRRGQWWYYSRSIEGQQYGVHCRCPVDETGDSASSDPLAGWTPPELDSGADVPGEQVLLDGNAEAEGHDFFSLGTFAISPDGHLLAYAVDVRGDERYTLRVKDLRTGELLPDEIPGTFAGATWTLDAEALYYTTVDDAWRPHRAWRHALGSDPTTDTLLHEEPDERYWLGVGATRSERFVLISSSSRITSEVRYLDATDPEASPVLVAERRDGVEYTVEHAVVSGQDVFLVLHNDGAVNFELAQTPVATPSPEHWIPLIPHRADTRLEDVDAFRDHIVLSYRREALTRIAVLPLTEAGVGDARELAFEETLFSCGVGGNPEWEQPVVRLGYTSFLTPSTVYDYVVATGELVMRKRQPVLGGYDPSDFEQHREWAIADDGTRVPISVVCRAGGQRDGTAPALLYGYGSYEISIDPSFGVARLSLLERGMVFAVAHVRGGGELGRSWYEEGKTLSKRNTFTDFVACARHLTDVGWTSADRMVAEGGSAGGLLMGAVANLAPDAFAGIVAVVPFVDPLTTILDPSLPLTVIEWDEWGDPLHDPDVYAYMSSYSPYENVSAKSYPPILAITSLNDTRVLYVEPAKWVARLRATADQPTVLLKTEMSAGHGGVSGRYEAWRERAYEYAWILDTAGAPHQPLS
ncbi:MAG TPA: S9 family peptidase [Nocardioidaceae bacterium]|nr:S9 family peptidase [Nocardioidaceae bacterium]